MKNIEKAEVQLQQIDNELIEACRRYGISQSEIEMLYEQGANEDQIRDFVKGKLGFFGAIRDKWTRGKYSEERINALKRIEEINNAIDEIHKNLGEIGKMIANVTFKTDKGLKFLNEALRGNIEKPGAASFIEARYSEEELRQAWDNYKANLRDENGQPVEWDKINDPVKKQFYKDQFMAQLKKKKGFREGSGIMAILFDMINQWVQTNIT